MVDTMPYVRIQVTLPKEVNEKLERIAKNESRPKANMIAWLIESYKE